MNISEYLDLQKLNEIMKEWSKATGMATIAMDDEGKYISGEVGFTDFCMKYTRGSQEGCRRCVKCDAECTGVYFCHAGLMDFSIDIVVGGKKVGKIIGGQILPAEPDEDKFRKIATEIGVNPDDYIAALRKIPIRDEESIRASARLLGEMVNLMANMSHKEYVDSKVQEALNKNLDKTINLVKEINNKSRELDKIESKQRILALNASIEAARAGEAGKGFAVVAGEISNLANQTNSATETITDLINNIYEELENVTKTINQAVENNKLQNKYAHDTANGFSDIEQRANQIKKSTKTLGGAITELASANESIVDSIQTISAITEEVSANSTETYKTSEKNEDIVLDIIKHMEELNNKAKELEA